MRRSRRQPAAPALSAALTGIALQQALTERDADTRAAERDRIRQGLVGVRKITAETGLTLPYTRPPHPEVAVMVRLSDVMALLGDPT